MKHLQIGFGVFLVTTFLGLAQDRVEKAEFYPGLKTMTAVEKSELYLELYPGTIYYVVSSVEVYDICEKELRWSVTQPEASPVDKRVLWTLQDFTPFSKDQREFLAKERETELILLTDVESWKMKNGWTKEEKEE